MSKIAAATFQELETSCLMDRLFGQIGTHDQRNLAKVCEQQRIAVSRPANAQPSAAAA